MEKLSPHHFPLKSSSQMVVEVNVSEDLEDCSETDMPQVTLDVALPVKKLYNGKSARQNEIGTVLLKNRREVMIEWLLEILQYVWRTK